MFNLQGSEIIVILLIALVILGPEKLPDAVRRFTKTYGELKKMGSGFQEELKSAFDEPVREMTETASLLQETADPTKFGSTPTDVSAGAAADPSREAETSDSRVAPADAPAKAEVDPGPAFVTARPKTARAAGVAAGVAGAPHPPNDGVEAPSPNEDDAGDEPINSIAAGNSSASIAARSEQTIAAANGVEPEVDDGSHAVAEAAEPDATSDDQVPNAPSGAEAPPDGAGGG